MKHSQLKETLKLARSINRPLMAWSGPGIGKSTAVHDFAKSEKLQVVDWRLTLMDTVDMRGTPWRDKSYTIWAPPSELRICESGEGILFLDELPQARMEVKNVAAMLVLERRIGEWKLGSGWWVCAAGNRAGDQAGTSPMPTHLNNRFWHVDLVHDISDWMEWAVQHDLDYRVIAYLKFSPDALFEFDPKSKDAAFATPRTWHAVSDIIKALGKDRDILKLDPAVLSEMISGNVGRKRGEEFVGFMRVMHEMVTMDAILNNPLKANVPDEPSVRYAVTTGLTRVVEKANVANAFTYMQRMGKEMAFVFARKLEGEQPALRKTAAFTKFCAENAEYI